MYVKYLALVYCIGVITVNPFLKSVPELMLSHEKLHLAVSFLVGLPLSHVCKSLRKSHTLQRTWFPIPVCHLE